jgi:hypothetical protein
MSDHPDLVAYLVDSYTGIRIPLNMQGDKLVSFTVNGDSSSRVANRFMVVFGKAKPAVVPVRSAIDITVYPNPIRNGQIGVKMNNISAGEYHYRLLNAIGEAVQTGNIIHSGGNTTYTIPVSRSNDKGVYELQIFGPDNEVTTIPVVY